MKRYYIGLVDADLLCGGTRHPNLVLMKIAGFLSDNEIDFKLIIDPQENTFDFDYIFMSRVFTFTKEPSCYINASDLEKQKFFRGGTGYYATDTPVSVFKEKRERDMVSLEKNPFLLKFRNRRGGPIKNGIDMARQMPYYHLYDEYIERQVSLGHKKDYYKDYLNYSIGFLTRKCYRHCPFCVNKLERGVEPYSKLEWFFDESRPHVYFWDDNFLAAPYNVWKPLLQSLIDNKISFQFRQGLDERQLAENEHGEEMAMMLSKAKYHGDYIFAFDNWRDREIIEKSLKIWKKYNPNKSTKFYLFCGYCLTETSDSKLYRDVWEIFQRIKILMQYGCLGYVMRHEDYHKHPLNNIYVQIARWCNQPAFYKKLSFWEFCYKNQTFWEENHFNLEHKLPLKTYEEFLIDVENGYYEDKKICLPLRTCMAFIEKFSKHKDEILEMFSYKLTDLIDSNLWENN